MLRSYVFGFFSAAAAVLVVAVIWFGIQPGQDDGLLWGDRVYTSKQEFEGYLKSKGLSYKTWAARHAGRAPWEPNEIAVGAITLRASTETREAWVVRLPLAALALIFATVCSFLLLVGLRRVAPRLASRPVAFASAVVGVLLVAVTWLGT